MDKDRIVAGLDVHKDSIYRWNNRRKSAD